MGNKVIHKRIVKKYNKYKKQNAKDQQTFKTFHRLYRNCLLDKFIVENKYESLHNIFTEYVDEKKTNLFYKTEHKKKIKPLP